MDNKYSESEFAGFMDWLADKGIMNSSTARARKLATLKVLSALDDHERLDLRRIDRDQTFSRFVNKFGRNFKPDSLAAFKGRFNNGLDEFLRYVEDPANFRLDFNQKISKNSENDEAKTKRVRRTRTLSQSEIKTPPPFEIPKNKGTLNFPIPIRDGVIVLINNMPTDLTIAEAEKIGAVVKALAVA